MCWRSGAEAVLRAEGVRGEVAGDEVRETKADGRTSRALWVIAKAGSWSHSCKKPLESSELVSRDVTYIFTVSL